MDTSFAGLIQGIRRGDADAATRLVRDFEPEIRRAIRIHLQDSSLKRLFDSMDICQSVMANFFVRASAGQFELDEPEKVIGLLVTMARNKLTDKARQQRGAQRHPGGEQKDAAEALADNVDPTPSASRILQGQELLEQIKRLLPPDEAVVLDYRAQGFDWAEIGAKLNAGADGLRKRFTRAMDRVVERMKIDSV